MYQSASETSQTLHILVIDDDKDDRFLINHYLDNAPSNFRLSFASNTATALTALQQPFDACLLDFHLGTRGNGLEILQQVDTRSLPGPVIMVTGCRDPKVDAAACDAGAADYLCKEDLNSTALDRSLRYAIASHKERIRLEQESRVDGLTGLLNRRCLMHCLETHLRAPDAPQVSVMYFDLDGFKSINDDYGHNVGDEVLRNAAQRLQQALPDNCRLGRFGGDEFVALIPGISPRQAELVANRVLESLREADSDTGFVVTTSIGLAHFPTHGDNAEALIQCADRAMYASKRNGRDMALSSSESDQPPKLQPGRLAQDLRQALCNDDLHLVYQPQFSNDGKRIISAEALARWTHPEFGPVSPEQFVNIAESSGLIRELTRWALGRGIKDLVTWTDAGLIDANFRLGINVSASQFIHQDLLQEVQHQLQLYPRIGRHLELELTEHAMIQDFERSVDIIESLQRLDIKVAIDDFGTKHSCMAYLARLPVDTIKLDSSFLANIGSSGREASVLRGLAALVHELGAEMVIEGVETREQHRAVKPLKSERLQGYLFARPMGAAEFHGLLHEQRHGRQTTVADKRPHINAVA